MRTPFECSNSNLVHQQNTIKQLFKPHSLKFTLLSFQHNFFKGKKLKIRSFHMKFRKKSGIAQNQEKTEIIRKIRKCLTDCHCLLLEKALIVWTTLNSLDQRMLWAKFAWIGPLALEKRMKIWKVYRQKDGQTNDS